MRKRDLARHVLSGAKVVHRIGKGMAQHKAQMAAAAATVYGIRKMVRIGGKYVMQNNPQLARANQEVARERAKKNAQLAISAQSTGDRRTSTYHAKRAQGLHKDATWYAKHAEKGEKKTAKLNQKIRKGLKKHGFQVDEEIMNEVAMMLAKAVAPSAILMPAKAGKAVGTAIGKTLTGKR